MFTTLLFLSSGLFLGWSLGANHAANIFGTAVGTNMLRFKVAAIISSIFVIIGAVCGGVGTSHTIGVLGEIEKLPGAFTVALAAALTMLWMTRAGLPVSTTQAIVGAILGWNLFSGHPTNMDMLYKIFATWVFSPVLTAIISIILFFILKYIVENMHIHLLRLDALTRLGFIIVGAFGAYSLGANNIGNIMGVFITSIPFTDMQIGKVMEFSAAQQLFLLGGIAIAIGICTYSKKVMTTVGSDIFKLSPITGLAVVLASSITLFLFASQALKLFLESHGLPSFPLVPVSSSQAVIGGVVGISIVKGGRNINLKLLGKIALGWIITPVGAGILAYIALFFVQNVFMQPVM
jgi:PiT family inorganic phosphate transporter